MRSRMTCTLLLSILLIAASCARKSRTPAEIATAVTDTTCPDSAFLVDMRDKLKDTQHRDQANEALRNYAWALFAQVTGRGERRPKWTFGHTVDSAAILQPQPDSQGVAVPVSLFRSMELLPPTSTDDSLRGLVTVLMNDASMQHIRASKLYTPAKIKEYQSQGVHQIPEFGCGSINVKATWRVIPHGASAPIGVWADDQTMGGDEWTWRKWILVDAGAANPGMPPGSPWDPSRRTYEANHKDAQLDEFYTVTLGSPGDFVWAGLTDDLKKLLHKGDNLILVGLHVAAKMDPDWIWTTFWWNPIGVGASHQKDMPAWVKDDHRWRNFAMNLDVSMILSCGHDDSQPPCPPVGASPPDPLAPVFNPYLEGTTLLNFTTNCMRCHKNASPDSDISNLDPQPPNNLEGKVLLDYVWSLQHILGNHHPAKLQDASTGK